MTRPVKDALLLLPACVVASIALIWLDAFDWFYDFSRSHEDWDLDELLMSLPVLVLALAVFALRRLEEVRQEANQRRLAEEKALAAAREARIAERQALVAERLAHAAEGLARKAEAEAEEARRTKEDFMAVMSHELCTPLNGLLGMLSLLTQESMPPDQALTVRTALDRGWALKRMVDDVMEFAALGISRRSDAVAPFAPGRVILDVHRTLAPLAREKGLDMPEPEVGSLPEAVTGMEAAVRHILLNIGGNAVKFTEQGQVRIRADHQATAGGKGRLILNISDTGPGIDVRDQRRIFEPYRQLDGSLSRAKGGIGLGLSLVKRLVDALGGSIAVRSEAGRGATFTVELPVDEASLDRS